MGSRLVSARSPRPRASRPPPPPPPTAQVLATPASATDGDFARIEGVVGHEYFHNWTGNRVTCRDWFQLTLKEGLTVYRDQEFSADLNSRGAKRVEDVLRLRAAQFPEDAGPMAHPVRPDAYIKMDNFYTVTVYEKGAEVVRMYEALLGRDGFRKGMDLYFERHDGAAVTCDDFLAAMADANGGVDLSGLAAWYGQAGTPALTASGAHDAAAQTYTLRLAQATPPTPGQAEKRPVLIPVRAALFGAGGAQLPLRLRGSGELGAEAVLRLEGAEGEFVFEGVAERPVPSLLRGFSAPVKLAVEGQSDADLLFLLAHDTDAFNRYEAGQTLARQLLLRLYAAAAAGPSAAPGVVDRGGLGARLDAAGGLPDALVAAFRALLADASVDGQYKAFAITLPQLSELVDAIPGVDPTLLHDVRERVAAQLAAALRPELEAAVAANGDAPGAPYEFTAAACARRALKNKALTALAALGDAALAEDLLARFRAAANMTDEMAALAALDRAGGAPREAALAEFYAKWRDDPLVLLKWLALTAGSDAPGNLAAVAALADGHEAVNLKNPNTCYSLFGGFARSPANFHAADGSGYAWLADKVLLLDGINRQVAARVVGAFAPWRRYDAHRRELMRAQLQRIADAPGLSENVFEIASKSLK